MSTSRTNWAGNVTFQAGRLRRPESLARLQEIVAASSQIRALGTGHSFSLVADTTGDQVSVAGLPARFEVAPDRLSATVSAGLRYGEVATRLHAEGLALANLGSLPHISVVGAVATGTHGSGESPALSRRQSSGSSSSPRPASCCGWTVATNASPAPSLRWGRSVWSPPSRSRSSRRTTSSKGCTTTCRPRGWSAISTRCSRPATA